VAARIEARGGRALAVQADVADHEAVESMFDRVEAELGPALVVVNNAGIRHDRLLVGLDKQHWDRVLAVNLDGAYHVMRRALAPMVRRRFGRIVSISTISASRPLPGQAAYAASKAGVEALTRTLALEVARRGVTVNAIEPGLVATDFVPEMTDEWASVVPARRTADPAEVAALVRFLASPEAGYLTGAVVPLDGGLTAGLGLMARPSRGAGASSRRADQPVKPRVPEE
jgi:3-oxoacyl-[acyl-carrier protein] reductase